MQEARPTATRLRARTVRIAKTAVNAVTVAGVVNAASAVIVRRATATMRRHRWLQTQKRKQLTFSRPPAHNCKRQSMARRKNVAIVRRAANVVRVAAIATAVANAAKMVKVEKDAANAQPPTVRVMPVLQPGRR